MNIDQITLLEKIIFIQSAIIEGSSVRAILNKEKSFFLNESGSDIIAVCIENKNRVDIELILEDESEFLSLLSEYKLLPKHMELNKFMQQCNSHFISSQERIRLESLHDIFDGHLSKKKTTSFENAIDFDHAFLYPILDKNKKKMGLIIYLFSKNTKDYSKRLSEMTEVFEVLLRPFYDAERKLLRAKCIQVDEKMERLTEKEKKIAHLILLGKQYKVIAQECNISINTLKTHVKNIFSKYGVQSKMELNHKLVGSF